MNTNERKIVAEKLQEYLVQEFVSETLKRVGHARTEVLKTPVGEKIIIHASRPGLIVGSKGANIKKLTKVLKTKFKFENPQIDIAEIQRPEVDAQLVAENIAYQLEKFGAQRFKAIGYSSMENAIKGGALGIEILMSGKLPSARAKVWRFYMGYLKKCGDLAMSVVRTAYMQALLKSGIIGIQVRILPQGIVLPDTVTLYSEMTEDDRARFGHATAKAEVSLDAVIGEGEIAPVVASVDATAAAETDAKSNKRPAKADGAEKKARTPRKKKDAPALAPVVSTPVESKAVESKTDGAQ